FDKLLQSRNSLQSQSSANVIGLIRRPSKVWRDIRLLPGDRPFGIIVLRRSANDLLCARSDRAEDDHVPLVTKVRHLSDSLVGNVIIGNTESVQFYPIPSFVLCVDPSVYQSYASRADGMLFYFGKFIHAGRSKAEVFDFFLQPRLYVRRIAVSFNNERACVEALI